MSTIAESLREEIADLRGCIDGLPTELREGPFGETYRARLEMLTDELAHEELLSTAREFRRPAMDLRVMTKTHSVEAHFMGELLQGWQNLVSALGQAAAGRPTSRGVIPADIVSRTKLDLVAFAPGSFVSRLVLDGQNQESLPGHEDLGARAFEQFEKLWAAGADHHQLTVLMGHLRGRVLSSYGKLLQLLARANTELRVSYAEPDSTEPREVVVGAQKAGAVVGVLDEVKGPEEEIAETVVGRLNAAHMRTGTFEIDLGDDGTLIGKIARVEAVAGLVIGKFYDFDITEIISTNPFTGEPEQSFVLTKATSRDDEVQEP